MEIYYYKKYTIDIVSGLYGKWIFRMIFIYQNKAVCFAILTTHTKFNGQYKCNKGLINVVMVYTYVKNSFTVKLKVLTPCGPSYKIYTRGPWGRSKIPPLRKVIFGQCGMINLVNL